MEEVVKNSARVTESRQAEAGSYRLRALPMEVMSQRTQQW